MNDTISIRGYCVVIPVEDVLLRADPHAAIQFARKINAIDHWCILYLTSQGRSATTALLHKRGFPLPQKNGVLPIPDLIKVPFIQQIERDHYIVAAVLDSDPAVLVAYLQSLPKTTQVIGVGIESFAGTPKPTLCDTLADISIPQLRYQDTEFYWNALTEELIGNRWLTITYADLRRHGHHLITESDDANTRIIEQHRYGNLSVMWLTSHGVPMNVMDIFTRQMLYINHKYSKSIKQSIVKAERRRRPLTRVPNRERRKRKMRRFKTR